ncbi:P-type conjugative transfer protein TrbJ [Hellea balneolensis]|uniref:P-type conjugative transfer protein TrbJ n=1 Tax=Hellea balneolensis TaxID=287478 RepID=UPI0005538C28|nr:P-type conjugative transfer protein TrbJ [Hellea balneolensis]
MARRSRIIPLALAAIIGLSHAPIASAQFGGIVYDPANFKQNFYTAVRSHTQIIRQAAQLRNEAQMLINQAKHLSKLDVNAAAELNRILSEIAYLNAQAENVAYEVSRTRQLVKEQYPETYKGMTEDDFYVRAEENWQMSRSAYNDAMVMQSKMVESLEDDRVVLNNLTNKSHGATGALQATQSTNQLIALLIKQSMQAQQMQVTQYRADSVEQARRLASEKEARERLKNFVGSDSAYKGTP